jgi:hypothetical protein
LITLLSLVVAVVAVAVAAVLVRAVCVAPLEIRVVAAV